MSFKKREEPAQAEPKLTCAARGCNLRWSVEINAAPGLCSYHAFTQPNEWPAITERLRMDGPWQINRASKPVDLDFGLDSKAWARKLKYRHERGDYLTQATIEAYKSALGPHGIGAPEKTQPVADLVPSRAIDVSRAFKAIA